MRKQYDFSKSVKNPYAKFLKKQVTLRLNVDFDKQMPYIHNGASRKK